MPDHPDNHSIASNSIQLHNLILPKGNFLHNGIVGIFLDMIMDSRSTVVIGL